MEANQQPPDAILAGEEPPLFRRARRSFTAPLAAGLLLLTCALLLWPWLRWRARPPSRWRVAIVDKTVPHEDRREHASLIWALNHAKVPAPGGAKEWLAARDYLGYRPEKRQGEAITPQALAGAGLIYIADTYGVYRADLAGKTVGKTGLDYSERVYGGLEESEVAALEAHVRGGGALVAEFNTFASPTVGAARARAEALLGLRWSGWSGRWFEDLADEGDVPAWARRSWKRHHGEVWAHQGPGYLLVNEDSRVEVLREGTEVAQGGLRLVTPAAPDPLLRDVERDLAFRYWFDVVAASEGSEELARYQWSALPAGLEVLRKAGLPARFPAIVRASRAPLRLYFAGDFADNQLNRGPYWLAGWPRAIRAISADDRDPGAASFYWGYYLPLLRTLFASSP